ncbi:alpha/beta hydrolase [Paenibacillus hexagrammi]|uniref:Esterase family protein n=1 Tax=Paenibacillus hexagrammi TaxID=2908839 RepID=A0ABY3SLT1_9BACL|nr:alpha/beta hydrolase family protein [Paenibacillus sp. YPD9-1]UJF35017.1 esterase family protein [Paenibacillus sp. YPD9-1]
MAFIDCHFYSETLGVSASMYVILPQLSQSQIGLKSKVHGDKHPTLYLLHGLSDDHTIWMRRTSIERYASELGLAVVMPAVNRSFYTDMQSGYKYWSFISEELPRLAQSFFPLSSDREFNYAAGLSMGGYGALKLVLSHPERFAAGASLSGVVDIARLADDPERKADMSLIFGDTSKLEGSESDLFHLAKQLSDAKTTAPRIYQCCGTEDFLYKDNVRFRDYCRTLDLDYTYEEEQGEHEWGYWDQKIQSVLRWLPLPSQ